MGCNLVMRQLISCITSNYFAIAIKLDLLPEDWRIWVSDGRGVKGELGVGRWLSILLPSALWNPQTLWCDPHSLPLSSIEQARRTTRNRPEGVGGPL